MKKPCLTTVLTDKDLSFTCDTGYYYLEMDAWAEETGTVVTGHGSTLNTESFDDGVKVNAGVFELSYEQRNVTVTLEIKAAPESEYPVWNITWNTDGGEFVQDDTYTVDTTFDWRRMYPLTETAAKMNPFPSSARISRQTGELADALVGWYLTPDFSDSPITSFQQLPLKSVTLYARWAPAVSIDSDIEFDDFIAFSLEDLTSTPDSPSKTIKAFPAEGNWPENATFVWLVDGVQVAGSSDTFTYTFTPCIHTVTCIVNGTSSESITVECVENN